MTTKHRALPKRLGGVAVEPCREPTEMHGGLWQAMVGEDGSVWEFDLRSGRVLKTMEADPEDCDGD